MLLLGSGSRCERKLSTIIIYCYNYGFNMNGMDVWPGVDRVTTCTWAPIVRKCSSFNLLQVCRATCLTAGLVYSVRK